MSQLDDSGLNASKQRNSLRRRMVKVLDSIRGQKILVLDPSLSGPLSLVTEFSFLKERGVERVFFLGPDPITTTDAESILYLCRPTLSTMNQVADQLSNKPGKDCHLYLVPRQTLLAERVLESRGVLGELTTRGTFPMGAIPIENDVYSLELTSAFTDLYLEKDFSCLHTLSLTLMDIQKNQGYFPRILGKGDGAKLLYDMVQRMRQEKGGDSSIVPSANLEALVLLDRGSDLVTPLLTQLTYEGLIDENYGIRHGIVEIPEAGSTRKTKVALNGADGLYCSLRDRNFAEVGARLHSEARRLDAGYQQRHAAQTVTQIREFVSKLGGLQAEHVSLKTHTSLAELIMDFTSKDSFSKKLEVEQNLVGGIINTVSALDLVSDLIDRQAPLIQVLRLMCLQCQVFNGLPVKLYTQYQKEVCQSYGYHHIATLNNLERTGLLFKQTDVTGSKFNAVSKAFRLVVDEVDEREPNDISYVYSGYAPLSVRLVQCGVVANTKFSGGSRLNSAALSATIGGFVSALASTTNPNTSNNGTLGPGWSKFEDVLRLVPGPTFDELPRFQSKPDPASELGLTSKLVVVVFIGGCTYAEIAALRYLSQTDEDNRKFIIITTHILSGDSILLPLIESSDPIL